MSLFCFFKQKTAYEMRISDWSSDVCSSDLHLDIDAREALVQALNAYEGAVVLISHDPHLIELTADRLWLVHGGTCKPFDGDMDDYRKLLQIGRASCRERVCQYV